VEALDSPSSPVTVAGIRERDEWAAAGQRYRLLKRALPAPVANGAYPSCRIGSGSLRATAVLRPFQARYTAGRAPAGAAGAGVFAFPRPIGIAFTNPAAVLTSGAFHGLPSLSGLLPRIFLTSDSAMPRGPKGDGQTRRVCRPYSPRAGRLFPAGIRADVGAFPATSLAGEEPCRAVRDPASPS
jgi:hypothetical protein